MTGPGGVGDGVEERVWGLEKTSPSTRPRSGARVVVVVTIHRRTIAASMKRWVDEWVSGLVDEGF